MKIENEFGSVELRLPNFPESMRLIGEIGLNENSNYFEVMAYLAEKARNFVKVNIEGIKGYDDMLNDPKYSKVINQIVTILSNRFEEFCVEKKSV